MQGQGQIAEALACYQRAVQLKPDYAEAHYNLGTALQAQGQIAEALACYQRALQLKPDFAEAHNNLGTILQAQGQLTEAIACYQRALQLKPDYAEAHYNLGRVLQDQGQLAEASTCYQRALQLKPDYAEAHNNLGTVLQMHGQLDEARRPTGRRCKSSRKTRMPTGIKGCSRSCRATSSRAGPSTNGAGTSRMRRHAVCPSRLWDGTPLNGQTILLQAEQGLGDAFQFIRYAPLVKKRGGTVLATCYQPLASLLRGCPGVDAIVLEGQPLPDFDTYAPLLSLPVILKTTLETIPVEVPYLAADGERLGRWRRERDRASGLRVGIVWQCRNLRPVDFARSAPLSVFTALGAIPGVRLFSLQKEPGTEPLGATPCPVADLGSRFDTFADTAAAIVNLDLVVTVDTAVAHLAGALGVPVWVVLPFTPDWRWLLDREDSPWYPSMRLFRQGRPAPGRKSSIVSGRRLEK